MGWVDATHAPGAFLAVVQNSRLHAAKVDERSPELRSRLHGRHPRELGSDVPAGAGVRPRDAGRAGEDAPWQPWQGAHQRDQTERWAHHDCVLSRAPRARMGSVCVCGAALKSKLGRSRQALQCSLPFVLVLSS